MPLHDLRFELADLTIELFEVIEQALHQQPKGARQLVDAIFKQFKTGLAMCPMLCGMIRPNSDSKPRIWSAWAVRALTKPWRTVCKASTLCCSIFLIGTKRMLGRLTASQIASASAAS